MRPGLILTLFFLAMLLAAASPASEIRDKAKRAAFRAQGLALCAAVMAQPRTGDFEAADASQGCDCTIDLFMTGKSITQLPSLDTANFRTTVKDELRQCLDRMAKVGVKRQASEPAEASTSQPSAPPIADPATSNASGSRQADQPAAPFSSIEERIGAWFAIIPLWAWGAIALAILFFAVLRKLAGRGDRRDLLGVPPSMRRGGPVRPKRSDPPRR